MNKTESSRRVNRRRVADQWTLMRTQPRLRLAAFAVLVGVLVLLAGAEPPPAKQHWPALARIKSSAVCESSGLIKSRTYPDIYWTHNDSGHRPMLYAIKLSGELIAEIPIEGARNADWEDIAIDDAGFIYIGDIGDNHLKRPSRMIYKVKEPDPFARPIQPAGPAEAWEYRYPTQRHNCESLFVHNSRLYIITKEILVRPTLYRLDPADDNTLTPVAVGRLPVGTATAADVSEDGRHLAVCGYGQLWVFDLEADLSKLEHAVPRSVAFPRHYQTEACAFDGDDVIVTAESRQIWRITAADIKAQRQLP